MPSFLFKSLFVFLPFLVTFISIPAIAKSGTKSVPYVEIYHEDAKEIIQFDAQFSVLGEGYSWSEGPLWIEKHGFLLFSDVPQNVIYKYEEGQGVSEYLKPSGSTGENEKVNSQGGNGLLLNEKGQLVIMQHGDRRVAIMDAPLNKPQTAYTTLVGKHEGKLLNSPNDGIFHSNGDLYFTDPPYGLKDRKDREIDYDGIYRLSPSGQLSLEDKSIAYPNGVILSTDEKRLIVAASDRAAAKWYQFDVADNGSLSNKRVFFDASELVGQDGESGLPDGMVLHSQGYIFATGPGGVFVFTENAKLLAKIRTGKATANCTLSADEKTLYMTAHNTLMSIPLK